MNAAEEIKQALSEGKIVVVSTYTRAWQYDKPAHGELFKCGKSGALYVKQGRQGWVCLSGAAVRIYTRKAK
jgi:hypothetical protein